MVVVVVFISYDLMNDPSLFGLFAASLLSGTMKYVNLGYTFFMYFVCNMLIFFFPVDLCLTFRLKSMM